VRSEKALKRSPTRASCEICLRSLAVEVCILIWSDNILFVVYILFSRRRPKGDNGKLSHYDITILQLATVIINLHMYCSLVILWNQRLSSSQCRTALSQLGNLGWLWKIWIEITYFHFLILSSVVVLNVLLIQHMKPSRPEVKRSSTKVFSFRKSFWIDFLPRSCDLSFTAQV
jgi:hypothetical protein